MDWVIGTWTPWIGAWRGQAKSTEGWFISAYSLQAAGAGRDGESMVNDMGHRKWITTLVVRQMMTMEDKRILYTLYSSQVEKGRREIYQVEFRTRSKRTTKPVLHDLSPEWPKQTDISIPRH
jgi:hypothetical protein